MVSVGSSWRALIRLSESPVKFAAAGLAWSALNDGVAVAISHLNGLHAQLFTLNGVHNRYLLLLHVATAYITFPSVWAFYAWTGYAPRRMLRDLRRDGVFTENVAGGEDPAAPSGPGSRPWTFLYAAGIIPVLAGAYFFWFYPPVREPGPVYFFRSHLASTLVLWFMLWVILCRIGGAIVILKRIFRQRMVRLQPFHGDRVGGFGALDRYARELLFFFGFLVFGILLDFAEAVSLRRDPINWILAIYISAFVLLAPTLFWATLWPVHIAMHRERDRILRALVSDDWRRASFGGTSDPDSTKRQLEAAQAARQLHDTVMTFPVWPFHIGRDVLFPLGEGFAAAVISHLLVSVLLRFR